MSLTSRRSAGRSGRRFLRPTAGALVVLLGAAGCSDDGDKPVPVLELDDSGAGTCLDVPDELGPEVPSLPAVPCSDEHTHEIYAVVPYDGGDVFPGLDALDDYAERVCLREFEPYVRISAFDSTLTFTWLTPTLDSWNNNQDRDVICVLADANATPLTKSMKGSKT